MVRARNCDVHGTGHLATDRHEEIDGAAFEGLVAQHLRAWIAYSGFDGRLYFWRTRKGNEVDFVPYAGGGFWVLEVENSRRVRRQDPSGLTAFVSDYPECTAALLYRGSERLAIDGIQCLPGQEFPAWAPGWDMV